MWALHAVEIVTVSKFVTCFVRCFSSGGHKHFGCRTYSCTSQLRFHLDPYAKRKPARQRRAGDLVDRLGASQDRRSTIRPWD